MDPARHHSDRGCCQTDGHDEGLGQSRPGRCLTARQESGGAAEANGSDERDKATDDRPADHCENQTDEEPHPRIRGEDSDEVVCVGDWTDVANREVQGHGSRDEKHCDDHEEDAGMTR